MTEIKIFLANNLIVFFFCVHFFSPARYDPEELQVEEEYPPRGGMPPSELILTGLRTILDVVRNINKKRTQHQRLPGPGNNSTGIEVCAY